MFDTPRVTFVLNAGADDDNFEARPSVAVVTVGAKRARELLHYMWLLDALRRADRYVESLLLWDASAEFYRVESQWDDPDDQPPEHREVLAAVAKTEETGGAERVDEDQWNALEASLPDAALVRTDADQIIIGTNHVRWQAWTKYGDHRLTTAEIGIRELEDIAGVAPLEVGKSGLMEQAAQALDVPVIKHSMVEDPAAAAHRGLPNIKEAS